MVNSLFLTTSRIYLPGTHEPAAADGSMVRIAVGLVLGPCCHGPKMICGNIFRTLDQLEASTLRFVERFYMVLFCFIKGLPLHGTATKMISTRIHTRDNVPCCEVTPNSSSHWRSSRNCTKNSGNFPKTIWISTLEARIFAEICNGLQEDPQRTCARFWLCTPPKSNIDTKNDGVQNVSPFGGEPFAW